MKEILIIFILSIFGVVLSHALAIAMSSAPKLEIPTSSENGKMVWNEY